MDERLRFVARLGVGQRRAAACPAERDVDRQRKAKSRHAHAKKGSNRWWDPIGGLQQRREQASFNVLTHQKIGLWQHVCQARQQGGFVFDRVGDRRAQSPFGKSGMGVSAQHDAAHGDHDHGL